MILSILSLPLAAWTPFVDPLYSIYPNIDGWWLPLLVPLAFLISLVFQAVKRPSLQGVTLATLWMTIKILFFMVLICAGVQIFYMLMVGHTTAPW